MTIVKKNAEKQRSKKEPRKSWVTRTATLRSKKKNQEVLGQTTAMRWVEKEQKRKVKMKKHNSAALVLLLLW